MLDIPKKQVRAPRSFTLLPTTIERLEELAVAYDTNASRVMEALIVQFAPKLMEQVNKNKEQA